MGKKLFAPEAMVKGWLLRNYFLPKNNINKYSNNPCLIHMGQGVIALFKKK